VYPAVVAIAVFGLAAFPPRTAAASVNSAHPRQVAQDPLAVAIDGHEIFVADGVNGVVRSLKSVSSNEKVVAGTGVHDFAGDGGPATAAQLCYPDGVAFDRHDNLAIADSINVDYGGDDHCTSFRVRVVAHATGTFFGQSMTSGDIYTVAGNGNPGFSGDGGAGTAAGLCYPSAVAVDKSGNLVIADSFLDDPIDDLLCGSNRVRVVAATTGTFYGQAMTAGNIYTVAGNGVSGPSGDGGPGTSAALAGPDGVAVDVIGNLVIADNFQVRVLAARTGTFYGQSMTGGNIYTVVGNGTQGSSGDGGRATSAQVIAAGVTVDLQRNLVIADAGQRIRVVAVRNGNFYGVNMTKGDIYTIAGTGTFGFSGDGGPAVSAQLRFPSGVAVDANGNLAVADSVNERVRLIAIKAGNVYGVTTIKGDIYTVAGNGLSGDTDGD
jgi:hypothetical protein